MKKQGYNDRLDERLGEKDGAARDFKQSYKDRRDESRGMERYEKEHNERLRHSHSKEEPMAFNDLEEEGKVYNIPATPDFRQDYRELDERR